VESSQAADFPLELRIPVWAHGATVSVNGADPVTAQAGTFHRINHRWTSESMVRLVLPLTTRAERRFNDSLTIYRGPIAFALQVGQDWRKLRDQPPTADWEVYPTTPWNYALAVDPANLADSFQTQAAAVA